jgi:GTPase SAR1 family protein
MEFIEVEDQDGNLLLVSSDLLIPYADGEEEDDEEELKRPKYNEWIKIENEYHPARDSKILKCLEPGYFGAVYANGAYKAVSEEIDADELFDLPNDIVEDVVNEIESFLDKAELFRKYKIVHKRGVMLNGVPGCGKTSLINRIAKKVIARGGYVFRIRNMNELNTYCDFIHSVLRVINPDAPIITVMEDIDSLAEQNESILSNFLDGDDQFDHNLILATTNRIHQMNDLMLRPSRFDWIITIETPTPEVREFYFLKKGVEEDEVKDWVKVSEGMTMADLKELFIAVKLLDNDLTKTVEKLKNQKKHVANSTFQPKPNRIGFTK